MGASSDQILAALHKFVSDPTFRYNLSMEPNKFAFDVNQYLASDESLEAGVQAWYSSDGRSSDTTGFLWITNQRLLYHGRKLGVFSRNPVSIYQAYDSIVQVTLVPANSQLDRLTISTTGTSLSLQTGSKTVRLNEFVELIRTKSKEAKR